MADSVRNFFETLQGRLNADAIKGMTAIYQFDISGADAGSWHVDINNGSAVVAEGTAEAPSITIRTDSDTWLGIVNGEIAGDTAFFTGKLSVEGDMNLAMQLQDVIGA